MFDKKWIYGSSVYWFWSSIPSAEEIERQVKQIAESGIKTFLIQARLSLPLYEYLGDEFLRAYRQAVLCAEKNGLKVGIYDDYNWMSGHAGGRTVQANQDLKERHLFWSSGKIINNTGECNFSEIHSLMYERLSQVAMNWAYQDGKVYWGNWKPYKVLAYPNSYNTMEVKNIIDITPFVSIDGEKFSCQIRVMLPDQKLDGWNFVAFISAQCLTSRMINYLQKEAAEEFTRVGLDPFEKAVGDLFGNTIQYIFFDHPYCGFYKWKEHCGNIANSLMFTEELPKSFSKRYKYPMEYALMAFLIGFGAQTPKLRCDFFECYGKLGRKSFLGTIQKWAHQHNLLVSGHELSGFVGTWGITDGFSSLDVRTNFGADYFQIDIYKDISAVDACNYQSQISPVIGASIAKANRKQGCMIEQYSISTKHELPPPVGNWGLSLNSIRLQAMRFLIQGMSHYIFHAFYLDDGLSESFNILENIRFDFPPGINFEPWFKYYHLFTKEIDYVSKIMQENLKSDFRKTSVAILYPLRTYWAEDERKYFSKHCSEWFQLFSKRGIEFDLIDESQIETSTMLSGNFYAETVDYPCLILPSITTLKSQKILRILLDYLNKGGIIFSSGERIRATQQDGVLVGASFDNLNILIKNPRYRSLLSPNHIFEDPLSIKIFQPHDQPFLICERKNDSLVWFRKIQVDNGWYVFLLNDSDTSTRTSFFCPTGYQTEQIKNQTRERESYCFVEKSEEHMIVILDMLPSELLTFQITPDIESSFFLQECPAPVRKCSIRNQIMHIQVTIEEAGHLYLELNSKYMPALLNGVGINHMFSRWVKEKLWKVDISLGDCVKVYELTGWELDIADYHFSDLKDLSKSWEELGIKDYKGEGIYQTTIKMDAAAVKLGWELSLPEYSEPFELYVNNSPVGTVLNQKCIKITPDVFEVGDNELKIVTINNGDSYYYNKTPYQDLIQNNSGRIGKVYLKPLVEFFLAFSK